MRCDPERFDFRPRTAARLDGAVSALTRVIAFAAVVIPVALTLTLTTGTAQVDGAGTVRGGFEAPEFDRDGNLKSLLTGQQADPVDTDQWQLTGMRVETYRYDRGNRVREIIVDAESCRFDYANRIAYSDGEIRMRTEDDQLQIVGSGFHWNQTTGYLVITNHLKTVVRQVPKPDSASGPAPGNPDVDDAFTVTSRRFEYDLAGGTAVYSTGVRVYNPARLDLTCETLEARLLGADRKMDRIVARERAKIDLLDENETRQVAGDEIVYTTEADGTERLDVAGNPWWKTERSEGQAEILLIQPDTKRFEAHGGGSLTLLPGPGPTQPPETEAPVNRPPESGLSSPVRVDFQDCVFTPDQVSFDGGVKAVQAGRLDLECQSMTVKLAENARTIEWIRAETGARLDFRSASMAGTATGARMDYRLDETGGEQLTVTGSPEWQTERYRGKGRTLRINLATREFESRGSTEVLIEPETGGSTGNRDQDGGGSFTSLSTDRPIVIRSETAFMAPGAATFASDVNVTHPNWLMTCDTLRFDTDRESNAVRAVHATGRVRMDHRGNPDAVEDRTGDGGADAPWTLRCDALTAILLERTGTMDRIEADGAVSMIQAGTTATGGHLTYVPASDRMELSKDPVLVTASDLRIVGRETTVLVLNTRTNQFHAEGRFVMQLPPESLRNRDIVPLP